MSLTEIFIVAISVSVDAMAVAAASGARYPLISFVKAVRMALCFGAFQFAMPLLGWLLGTRLNQVIVTYDYWIIFLLLSGVGIKFIFEAHKTDNDRPVDLDSWKTIVALSVATSLDALAVGAAFAFFPVQLWSSLTIIGITTFILSLASIYLGKKSGERWGKKATIFAGIILIAIGSKIVLLSLISSL